MAQDQGAGGPQRRDPDPAIRALCLPGSVLGLPASLWLKTLLPEAEGREEWLEEAYL